MRGVITSRATVSENSKTPWIISRSSSSHHPLLVALGHEDADLLRGVRQGLEPGRESSRSRARRARAPCASSQVSGRSRRATTPAGARASRAAIQVGALDAEELGELRGRRRRAAAGDREAHRDARRRRARGPARARRPSARRGSRAAGTRRCSRAAPRATAPPRRSRARRSRAARRSPSRGSAPPGCAGGVSRANSAVTKNAFVARRTKTRRREGVVLSGSMVRIWRAPGLAGALTVMLRPRPTRRPR